MMRLLADECCPRAVVDRLRADGHDVRYAVETDHRAADLDLLSLARAEGRVIVTEDFDFGDLLIRDQLPGAGCIILYLAKLTPDERATRLADALADPAVNVAGMLTIVEPKRVRQRPLRLA